MDVKEEIWLPDEYVCGCHLTLNGIGIVHRYICVYISKVIHINKEKDYVYQTRNT